MLARFGVITVQVLNDKTRKKWEDRIWSAMDEFPEYRRTGRTVQRVLGGFGALGNPSSFHHPTVQTMRRRIKKNMMMPLMRAYAEERGFVNARCEQLFDRIAVRMGDFGSVTSEGWHRDIYDGSKYGLRNLPSDSLVDVSGQTHADEIYGGWINLSPHVQRFVGIVESHKGARAMAAQQKGGGFAELTEDEVRDQRVEERLLRQANRKIGTVRTDAKGHIIVPPGHMVLFYQRLLHSVAGGKQPSEPSLRIFNGVRITGEDVPLFDHDEVIDNNAVPRIPSGQRPPMYSNNHYNFFSTTAKYREWGETTFNSEALFARVVKRTGTKYYTPGSKNDRNKAANKGRYMPSLAEMGFNVYPYSDASRQTMYPTPLFDQE
jgi:hypothetical protein